MYGPIRVVGKTDRYQGRFEHGAEVVGMLFGEFGGITDADDPAPRFASEETDLEAALKHKLVKAAVTDKHIARRLEQFKDLVTAETATS